MDAGAKRADVKLYASCLMLLWCGLLVIGKESNSTGRPGALSLVSLVHRTDGKSPNEVHQNYPEHYQGGDQPYESHL